MGVPRKATTQRAARKPAGKVATARARGKNAGAKPGAQRAAAAKKSAVVKEASKTAKPTAKAAAAARSSINAKKVSGSSNSKEEKNASGGGVVPACIKYDEVPPIARRVEQDVRRATPGAVVAGVDEAGRGPLFGPVVVAACVLPDDVPPATLALIQDSKAVHTEKKREHVYEQLVAVAGLRYAVACVAAGHIDAENIFHATMDGMANCCHALMEAVGLGRVGRGGGKRVASTSPDAKRGARSTPHGSLGAGSGRAKKTADGATAREIACRLCMEPAACYTRVAHSGGGSGGVAAKPKAAGGREKTTNAGAPADEPTKMFHALVDGNKVPTGLRCAASSIVSGDACETSIAAASILAKVTRDRIMHRLAAAHPQYGIAANKGYPTEGHRALLREHGASPQHRRSYRPVQEALELAERRAARQARTRAKKPAAATAAKPVKKPAAKRGRR